LPLEVTTINDPAGVTIGIEKVPGLIEILGGKILPGDCDGNGRLTVNDAICALQMSVGLMAADSKKMDMDGDQQITSRDAAIILQQKLAQK
jgi:hypothetical protein